MGTKATLTRREVLGLWNAIKALDGRYVLEKDSDGKGGFIQKPYDLEAKVVYAIAKTTNLLQCEIIALEKAFPHVKNTVPLTDPAKLQEFDAFMEASIEVEVFQVDVASIKIDTNKLPPTVVAGLMPMLKGEL